MQDEELQEICGLPSKFREGNLAWHELVHRSPYFKHRDVFTEDRIASFLKGNPRFIELWLSWSQDKRATPSAFFQRSGLRYELGYLERGGRSKPSEFFKEPSLPCARFILYELAV